MSKKLIDLDLLSQFKTNADNTYLIKHAASGTIPDQVIETNVFIGTDASPKDLTVAGDLYVKGTEHVIEVETMSSQANLVVTNSNNSPLGSEYTGLVSLTGETTAGREAYYTTPAVAPTSETYRKNVYYTRSGTSPNYVYTLATGDFDSSATYYIKISPAYALSVYDPTNDVIQLGSGTYKSTGEFEFGTNQAQAVATRQSSIPDHAVLSWDSGFNQITDSGYTKEQLVVTSGAQSIAGIKTFSDGIKLGSDTTTLTGVETTPTNNSTKVVTSGGLYTALSNKQALNSKLTSISNDTNVPTNTTGLLKFTNGAASLLAVSSVSTQTQSTKFLREDGTWSAPSYTTNSDTWRKVQLGGVDKLGTATNTNPLNIVQGNYMSITESSGSFTFAVDAASAMTDNKPVLASTVNNALSNYAKKTEDELITGSWTMIGPLYVGSPDAISYAGTRISGYDADSGDASEVSVYSEQSVITMNTEGISFEVIDSDNNYTETYYLVASNEITASNSYELTLPKESGTLAITDDIPTNYVTTDSNQTITGNITKSWVTTSLGGMHEFYNSNYDSGNHRIRIETSASDIPYINLTQTTNDNRKGVILNETGIIFSKKITPVSTAYTQSITVQMDQSTFSSNANYTINIPKIATGSGETAYFVGTKNSNLTEISLATIAEINALFGISA